MQVVIARIVGQDRADADHGDLRLPGTPEHIGDGAHVDQHFPLGSTVGKQRSMDLERPATKAVSHQGRDVIDVRIVLALHTSGHRYHFDAIPPLRLQPGDDGADALAAGDANGVAVRDLLQQQPRRRLSDSLKRRLGIV